VFEISLCITSTQHIAVEAVLEELGALSISLHDAVDDPVFVLEVDETPLWKQITLTALFEEKLELAPLQHTLEEILACPLEISIRTIDEQDWQNTWLQGLQPMQFGERLWICPSWCTSPDPFAVNIQLDPGIAFGTGTHPTTALCIEWLANHPPCNKAVIDFGCGSGILAITAHYLGAKSVLAFDHDPQAVQATRANAICNQLSNCQIKVAVANEIKDETCEVLLANVLLQPLITLEQNFADTVQSTGKIILSGILQSQLDELTQAYQTHFDIHQIYIKNEWLLVEATRL
jgi:ribosomal protein L11 methyltransferase